MLVGTRVLQLTADTGVVEVPVRIFQPVEDGSAWACRYEIAWPFEVRQSAAWGVDALQAVHAAMQRIAIELYMSPYHAQGLLAWGDGAGYGFPMPKNGRDLLVGYDREFDG